MISSRFGALRLVRLGVPHSTRARAERRAPGGGFPGQPPGPARSIRRIRFIRTAEAPRLTTPQWIGQPGVEAAVILAIDDMRDSKRYEAFLRPVLDRLKQIDGRAPLSIMTCVAQPEDAQLQKWLGEGLSIEVHTLAHPCPLLQKGSLASAEQTVFGCLDLLDRIPGSRSVAFRMPCCDSMNSSSPRFYAEIFNGVSPGGNFLTISSSVMNIFTPGDPALPRELVLDANGASRFRKYFPAETNAMGQKDLGQFAGWIENHPYPYVVGKLCWEFPMIAPSDWDSFNIQGKANPALLADWKAGLDATVLKKGVFTMVFHPYGWSAPQQFVDLIRYASAKYGQRIKFLNFREAADRLNQESAPRPAPARGQRRGQRSPPARPEQRRFSRCRDRQREREGDPRLGPGAKRLERRRFSHPNYRRPKRNGPSFRRGAAERPGQRAGPGRFRHERLEFRRPGLGRG